MHLARAPLKARCVGRLSIELYVVVVLSDFFLRQAQAEADMLSSQEKRYGGRLDRIFLGAGPGGWQDHLF